ncbi:hypothetical protein QUB68_18910 [Microcoleus sp. A006_D1]
MTYTISGKIPVIGSIVRNASAIESDEVEVFDECRSIAPCNRV